MAFIAQEIQKASPHAEALHVESLATVDHFLKEAADAQQGYDSNTGQIEPLPAGVKMVVNVELPFNDSTNGNGRELSQADRVAMITGLIREFSTFDEQPIEHDDPNGRSVTYPMEKDGTPFYLVKNSRYDENNRLVVENAFLTNALIRLPRPEDREEDNVLHVEERFLARQQAADSVIEQSGPDMHKKRGIGKRVLGLVTRRGSQ